MGAGEVVCVKLCCVSAFHARENVAGTIGGGGIGKASKHLAEEAENEDAPWIRKQVSWSLAMKMNIAYDTIHPLPSRI